MDILTKLKIAEVSSCTCVTKTPDIRWHKEDCRYRVLEEAIGEIVKLRKELSEAGWGSDPGSQGTFL